MKKLLATLMTSAVLTSLAYAGAPVSPEQANTLKTAVQKARPGMSIGEIRSSTVPGLFEVDLGGKDTVYMSADGKYLITGTMYRVENKKFVNIADERMQPMRVQKLAAVKKEDMVIFSPQGKPKSYVTVFTDIDCGFCRKLHQEVPQLNAMGIEVRYLAYPRSGVPSPSSEKLTTVWCAKDRQDALTKMKNGSTLPTQTCASNAIATQYQLGNELGISGTPALFTPNGELLPGYMPAKELAATLGVATKTAQ
ncbi:MAG: thioredoxin fold domain-containing protein [Pseudomonadales bacterium]